MAAAKVFDTIEVLEAILLYLPIEDIFRTKAVAPSWKATVENSIKLKRALFLATDGDPIPRCSPPDQNYVKMSTFTFNPLFKNKKEALPTAVEPLARHNEFLHPQKHSKIISYEILYDTGYCSQEEGMKLPVAYRSMFLTQPPMTKCEASVLIARSCRRVMIYDKDGITLGFVADTLAKLFQQLGTPKDGVGRIRSPWHYVLQVAGRVTVRFVMSDSDGETVDDAGSSEIAGAGI